MKYQQILLLTFALASVVVLTTAQSQSQARRELGNGKTAEETSELLLQKAKNWIGRIQAYTHDYTTLPNLPVRINPIFVHAIQEWTEEYDKKQQAQAAQIRLSRRQDDGDDEDLVGPVRSPSIVRVAADVLLAVVGNRNDSLFNLTHQIQNVGKFVVNPVQGITDLSQNVNRFLGIGQKSGADGAVSGEPVVSGGKDENVKVENTRTVNENEPAPAESRTVVLTKTRKLRNAVYQQ